MRGIFCGTSARTNEEYKIVVKNRIKMSVGLILIGMITAAVVIYTEFYTQTKLNEHIMGVYTGVGTGLAVGGLVLLIKNIILLKNEDKLKTSRLSNTDERIQEIGNKAFRFATYVMLVVMYLAALIGGIFIPELIRALLLIVSVFLFAYIVSYSYYNKKM